jgi:hypothetical protein
MITGLTLWLCCANNISQEPEMVTCELNNFNFPMHPGNSWEYYNYAYISPPLDPFEEYPYSTDHVTSGIHTYTLDSVMLDTSSDYDIVFHCFFTLQASDSIYLVDSSGSEIFEKESLYTRQITMNIYSDPNPAGNSMVMRCPSFSLFDGRFYGPHATLPWNDTSLCILYDHIGPSSGGIKTIEFINGVGIMYSICIAGSKFPTMGPRTKRVFIALKSFNGIPYNGYTLADQVASKDTFYMNKTLPPASDESLLWQVKE